QRLPAPRNRASAHTPRKRRLACPALAASAWTDWAGRSAGVNVASATRACRGRCGGEDGVQGLAQALESSSPAGGAAALAPANAPGEIASLAWSVSNLGTSASLRTCAVSRRDSV